MPKNTTDKTFMWKGGAVYPPGADIPEDLAKALGGILASSEVNEGVLIGTEEELKPQSLISEPLSSTKKDRKS